MTSHVVVAIPTAFSAEHAYRPVSDGLTGLILISITSLEERKKQVFVLCFSYFNELFGRICTRMPSMSVRTVPFFDHFNIGSGQASARQLSIRTEPLSGR